MKKVRGLVKLLLILAIIFTWLSLAGLIIFKILNNFEHQLAIYLPYIGWENLDKVVASFIAIAHLVILQRMGFGNAVELLFGLPFYILLLILSFLIIAIIGSVAWLKIQYEKQLAT